MAQWSELPRDIVELIAEKLPLIVDFTRCNALCRSWRLVESKRRKILSNPQLPLLMLIEGREDGTLICNFYSLPENELLEMKLPNAHGERCVGSRIGWVVTVDAYFNMPLLNPFTGAQFQLPSVTTFKDQLPRRVFTPEQLCDATVCKAILSSSTSSPNNDCVVLAIHGYWHSLGLARPGDKAWTPIKTPFLLFDDAIYYKGNFYAVSATRGVCLVETFTYPRAIWIADPVPNSSAFEIKYWVDSCGELLQVVRKMVLSENVPEYWTLGFWVFKMAFGGRNWEEVKSLGSHTLFLGKNTSISLNAANFPEIKEDCIYFSDDGHPKQFQTEVIQKKDTGIFHMKDKSIEPLHVGHTYRFPAPPLWVIPNPLN